MRYLESLRDATFKRRTDPLRGTKNGQQLKKADLVLFRRPQKPKATDAI